MRLIYLSILSCFLLINTACLSEEEQQHESRLTPAPANKEVRSLSVMPKETPAKPKINQFIAGGSLKKKIRTSFFADNSYIVLYETKERTPTLEAILVTPDDSGEYNRIDIASFPYEGGVAKAEDVFLANADSDSASELFMIITWKMEHKALGIDATNYKIFVFDDEIDNDSDTLKPISKLMEYFGSGNEGEMETGTVHYKYKDRDSILHALDQMSR